MVVLALVWGQGFAHGSENSSDSLENCLYHLRRAGSRQESLGQISRPFGDFKIPLMEEIAKVVDEGAEMTPLTKRLFRYFPDEIIDFLIELSSDLKESMKIRSWALARSYQLARHSRGESSYLYRSAIQRAQYHFDEYLAEVNRVWEQLDPSKSQGFVPSEFLISQKGQPWPEMPRFAFESLRALFYLDQGSYTIRLANLNDLYERLLREPVLSSNIHRVSRDFRERLLMQLVDLIAGLGDYPHGSKYLTLTLEHFSLTPDSVEVGLRFIGNYRPSTRDALDSSDLQMILRLMDESTEKIMEDTLRVSSHPEALIVLANNIGKLRSLIVDSGQGELNERLLRVLNDRQDQMETKALLSLLTNLWEVFARAESPEGLSLHLNQPRSLELLESVFLKLEKEIANNNYTLHCMNKERNLPAQGQGVLEFHVFSVLEQWLKMLQQRPALWAHLRIRKNVQDIMRKIAEDKAAHDFPEGKVYGPQSVLLVRELLKTVP